MRLASLLHSKLFIGITAGVVAAAGVATGLILKNRADGYRVIKVFEVNGQAVVSREKVGDIDPYSGMNLENGDNVSTYKDSSLRMVLDDTKYLLMEPETQLELKASGNAKNNKTQIVLKDGAVLNEITQKLPADSSYEVTAPKATMAVHGTSFRVKVEKQGDDYITTLATFHGKVKVNLLDKKGKPTDKNAMVGEDRCVMIKTVPNDKSGKDPIVDGTSFFIFSDMTPVPEGMDPTFPIDYYSIPYNTLKEIYDTDDDNEIKLFNVVLQKVIDAMNGGEDEPEESSSVVDDGSSSDGSSKKNKKKKKNKKDDSSLSDSSATDESSGASTTTTVTTTAPSSSPSMPGTTTVPSTTTAPPTTSTPDSTTTTKGRETDPTDTTTTTSPTSTTTTTTTATDPPIPEYSVSFYDYDGKLLSKQTVKKGGSATAPTNYTKSYIDSDGWTMVFSKWDTDFTKVKSDLTVKPVYEAKSRFTVKFYNYDGTILDTQTIEEGKDATAPSIAETYTDDDGWTMVFSKWDTDFTKVKSNLTVKPIYEAKARYTVKFYNYDGTILDTQTIEEGKDATAPSIAETYTDEDGWTMVFSKWDTDFTKVKSNLTVKPVYEAKSRYTVKFYNYDGTILDTQTIEEGKDATAPEIAKTYTDKDGWTMVFSKWDTDFTKVKSNLTVKPIYEAKSRYTVKFYNYDGEILDTQTIEEGKDATAPEIAKTYTDDDGWTMVFQKWDTDFTKVKSNLTVKPIYEAKDRFTVKFYNYDGTVLDTQTIEEGKDATAPSIAETYTDEDGWTMVFQKWDTDFTKVKSNLTVKPVYEAKSRYTVKFYNYDGTVLDTQTIEEGKDATAPSIAKTYTDDGGWTMVFSKWDTDFTKVKSNLTVKPIYEAKARYTVKFYNYDGTVLDTQTIEEGKDATAPSVAETYIDEDGWTMVFQKWDTDFTKVKSNLTVKPVYEAKARYTVKFYSYDGTVLDTQTIEEGKDATAPSIAETYTDEDGWTMVFSKWDTDFTKIKSDLTVKPIYEAKARYTVKFYNYDGTVLDTQTIEEGKDATAPSIAETYTDDDGWTMVFSKWDTDFTKVKSNLTVKPVYEAKVRYTVKFYSYDGTILDTQTVEEGKDATAPEGYPKMYEADGMINVFDGWEQDFTNVTSDLKVYPRYTEGFKIEFLDYEGNLIGEPQFVAKGDDAVPPDVEKTIETSDGTVVFVCWSDGYLNVAENAEVYAIYGQPANLFLYDQTGDVDKDVSPDEQVGVESEYELSEGGSSDDGYDIGWFHATSGLLASSTEEVSTANVCSDDESNYYIKLRHAKVSFSSPEGISEQVTLFCANGKNYYMLSEGGTMIDFSINYASEDFPLEYVPTVAGLPIINWLFSADGKTMTYAELFEYLQSANKPVLITDVQPALADEDTG